MTNPSYHKRRARLGEEPPGRGTNRDAGGQTDTGLGQSPIRRAPESGAQDASFDDDVVMRQQHLQSLINRAMRFCNRVEIEDATWEDDKNFISCNDRALEAELGEECRALDAELLAYGMSLGEVASGLERREFFYDPRYEDPVDLERVNGAPDTMDDFDAWTDNDWGDE